jgi:hypothetical protein
MAVGVGVVQRNGVHAAEPVSANEISALSDEILGLSTQIGSTAARIRDPDFLRSYAGALDDEQELAIPEVLATLRATADAPDLDDNDRVATEEARASWKNWAEAHILLLRGLLDEATDLLPSTHYEPTGRTL